MSSNSMGTQSIANETWQMIEQVNSTLDQTESAQNQGQGQIAQSNRSSGLQQLSTDVVISANPDGQPCPTTLAKNLGPGGQPRLVSPSGSKGFTGADPQNENIIQVMGAVMKDLAQSDQDFWNNMWALSTTSMQLQAQLAPITGQAVLTQYEAKEQATLTQAAMASFKGQSNLMGFAGAIVLSAYQEFKEPSNTPKDPAVGYENEDDQAESGTAEEKTAADAALNPKPNSVIGKAGELWQSIKARAPYSKQFFFGFLNKMQDGAEKAAAMAALPVNYNDVKCTGQQGVYQGLQQEAGAAAKETQMAAKGYDQVFSGAKDIGKGAGQNLSAAMNLLLQSANKLTQSAVSMFRG